MPVPLTRFWIEFERAPNETRRSAFGVTAYDREDALALLRQEYFDRDERPVPPIKAVTEGVDVSTLDEGHVLPNMPLQSGAVSGIRSSDLSPEKRNEATTAG